MGAVGVLANSQLVQEVKDDPDYAVHLDSVKGAMEQVAMEPNDASDLTAAKVSVTAMSLLK